MGSNGKTFKTIVLEDGACAVVRTDPSEPSILQVVAVFYDAARARKYADMENGELLRDIKDRTSSCASSQTHSNACRR